MKTSQPTTRVIPVPGLFSLLIAPGSEISGALSGMKSSGQAKIRYICSSFPTLLPGIGAGSNSIRVTTIQSPDQIIPAIRESSEVCILIEHDASFYSTDADLIRPIAKECRKKVSERQHSVLMVASRPDGWLKRYEPFVHRCHAIHPGWRHVNTFFQ